MALQDRPTSVQHSNRKRQQSSPPPYTVHQLLRCCKRQIQVYLHDLYAILGVVDHSIAPPARQIQPTINFRETFRLSGRLAISNPTILKTNFTSSGRGEDTMYCIVSWLKARVRIPIRVWFQFRLRFDFIVTSKVVFTQHSPPTFTTTMPTLIPPKRCACPSLSTI